MRIAIVTSCVLIFTLFINVLVSATYNVHGCKVIYEVGFPNTVYIAAVIFKLEVLVV
jgi:hypothetical protein